MLLGVLMIHTSVVTVHNRRQRENREKLESGEIDGAEEHQKLYLDARFAGRTMALLIVAPIVWFHSC